MSFELHQIFETFGGEEKRNRSNSETIRDLLTSRRFSSFQTSKWEVIDWEGNWIRLTTKQMNKFEKMMEKGIELHSIEDMERLLKLESFE